MQNVISALGSVFEFLNTAEVAGMSIVTWFVIVLICSGIGFIIRGNKS